MTIWIRLSAVLVMPMAAFLPAAEPGIEILILNPPRIVGEAGANVQFSVELGLRTSAILEPGRGLRAWSFGIAVSGGQVKEVVLAGLEVSTVFDDDGNPETPPVDPSVLDLGDAFLHTAETASGDYPGSPVPGQNGGVVSVILDEHGRREILQAGFVQLGRFVVEAAVPSDGCAAVGIALVDGLRGSGEPVVNRVRLGEQWVLPELAPPQTTWVCSFPPRFELAAVPEGFPVEPTPEGGFLARPEVPVRSTGSAQFAFEVSIELTSETGIPDGPQGWSLSIAHDSCLELLEAELSGVVVETLFDEDGDSGTPPVAAPFDLSKAAFKVVQRAQGVSGGGPPPSVKGVVSALVLDFARFRSLRGDSVNRVLRLRYEWTRPIALGTENAACRIRFLDGLKGVAGPVSNAITYLGMSLKPAVHDLTIRPIGVPAPMDDFIRGDPNGDGRTDIADAVRVVGAVVAGAGPPLLCRDAGDVNDDELLDITDAVYLIGYEFRAGAAPPLPFPGCGTDADSTPEKCPPGTSGSCGS